MYTILAILTGGFVALMIQVNGNLQIHSSVIASLLVIHLSGLVTSAGYLLLAFRFRSAPASDAENAGGTGNAGNMPFWFVIAGALGAGVVFLTNAVFVRGGVLLTLSGTLAGQTLAAHLLEGTRWFEGRRSSRIQRVVALALILPGTVLIGLRSGAGPIWIAVSWIPGLILMVQSMMNSRNALRFGQPQMVVLNYVSALVVLVPLAAAFGLLNGATATRLLSLPPALLAGGGFLGVLVVATSAYLFNRASALKVVLGLYAGQIAVGVVLDLASGMPLRAEKVVGIFLVVLGLGAEQFKSIWRSRSREN